MRKRIMIATILTAAFLASAGCSSNGGMPENNGEQTHSIEAGWDNGRNPEPEGYSDAAYKPDYGGHKVIRRAEMSIETRNFQDDIAYINRKAVELGGYAAAANISGKEPNNYGDP